MQTRYIREFSDEISRMIEDITVSSGDILKSGMMLHRRAFQADKAKRQELITLKQQIQSIISNIGNISQEDFIEGQLKEVKEKISKMQSANNHRERSELTVLFSRVLNEIKTNLRFISKDFVDDERSPLGRTVPEYHGYVGFRASFERVARRTSADDSSEGSVESHHSATSSPENACGDDFDIFGNDLSELTR